ncbi:MAG: hypothetical protein Q9219_006170 [cf. Caloplaca sp. 3 TL-2023]
MLTCDVTRFDMRRFDVAGTATLGAYTSRIRAVTLVAYGALSNNLPIGVSGNHRNKSKSVRCKIAVSQSKESRASNILGKPYGVLSGRIFPAPAMTVTGRSGTDGFVQAEAGLKLTAPTVRYLFRHDHKDDANRMRWESISMVGQTAFDEQHRS